MPDDMSELQQLMESAPPEVERKSPPRPADTVVPAEIEQLQEDARKAGDVEQWTVAPDSLYLPSGRSVPTLPARVYAVGCMESRCYLQAVRVLTDDLIRLDDTTADQLLAGMETFWKPETSEKFLAHGLLYKRGILMWGPAGGGKTATVQMLARMLIERGGVVILGDNPSLTSHVLRFFRQIEPERQLVVILEDLEEIMERHGEKQLLGLLDGEHQIGNVVYIATTNFPEKLGPRVINRPSRFDEIVKIGMPNAKSRELYLRHALQARDGFQGIAVPPDSWIEETEGLSIAHLRELVIATQCLGRPYEETIKRLKDMGQPPHSARAFASPAKDLGERISKEWRGGIGEAAATSPGR